MTTDNTTATQARSSDQPRFEPGVFTPHPRRSGAASLIWAQAKMETKLFMRHGEQQLLSMVIPIALLVGMRFMPFMDLDDPMKRLFPMVLAIAVMSAGFTGQAIAVAFDRRYGALKRMGASALPKWAIISGKIVAVVAVVIVQTLVLGTIAFFLGFSTPGSGLLLGLVFLVLGTATFTALGLLLGGTLGSELVLALANLVWFVLLGLAMVVAMTPGLREGVHALMMLVPSVALTQGLIDGFQGHVNFFALAILAVWAAVGTFAATKLFRFTA